MFRKKQTPQPVQRNVRAQQSARVFSYYASRSPESPTVGRTMTPKPQARKRFAKDTFKYAPSLIAAVVILVSLVYGSTLSTMPNVQILRSSDQTLVGSTQQYEKEAQKILNQSLLNRSKLTIDTSKVAAELREAFPELGNIAVVLPLVGRRPIIQAQPALPALVLGTRTSGAFVVDVNGRAIVKASQVDSSIRDALPVIQDESGVSLEAGKSALPEVNVRFITEVAGQLKAKNIAVDSLNLSAARELRLRLKERPYYVKFDVQGEARQQVGAFVAVKERLEKDNVLPAEYIDVRIPDKVFYK
jgi:hypothetical protein